MVFPRRGVIELPSRQINDFSQKGNRLNKLPDLQRTSKRGGGAKEEEESVAGAPSMPLDPIRSVAESSDRSTEAQTIRASNRRTSSRAGSNPSVGKIADQSPGRRTSRRGTASLNEETQKAPGT